MSTGRHHAKQDCPELVTGPKLDSRHRVKQPKHIKVINYFTPAQWRQQADKPRFLRVNEASSNPCMRCPGHCCALLLTLTVFDIGRIVKALGLHPRAFCHLEPSDDSWRAPRVDIDGQAMQIMLNSSPHKACVFLHSIGDQRRCSIYGLRPMTCRLYPFRWLQDNDVAGPKCIWCPEQWVLDANTRRRIVRTIRQSIAEEQMSDAIMGAFTQQKKHPATSEGLYAYVLEQAGLVLDFDAQALFHAPQRQRLKERLW